ncbi:3-hydroxyacyl-CoA dehydrogenase [Altererythrobacter sp. B11]|uniref:3-hydroxyacyl-CoA dehydrogenase NAD-binding domain-containing protein n=1 Tax=Altererythrobacter sp. B11 TaxID=2060312 RepID=UPI000DC6DEB1|nr:3-hydroxyacyl-CoA dehydrogenase NAD-binding domain-containing protein [Altererythrobacter sp. B11]BBC73279.1 3-hydroxyacyl-CoA dehydrogenase [Altererythrobacter sp. B11]
MPVHQDIIGRILVLRVDNPPVNALSKIERRGLIEGIARGASDDVDAIVLTGAGASFIAGADIREFGKPPEPPHLPEVVETIEASAKPVIAAIAGQALGGGLEVALACHYRLAEAGARFGLPETTLGIVPGAGGTQRLPRLIDPMLAADMVATGKSLDAASALRTGLIDWIADQPIDVAALGHARSLAGQPLDERRLSERNVEPSPDAIEDLALLKAETVKKSRGAIAPGVAIDLVAKALQSPYDVGVAEERARFLELRSGSQAAALRHIFFAEREAAKGPAEAPRSIERVGVIGAGTMGAGIAMSVADAGIPVVLVEQTEAALGAGLDRIARAYGEAVARNRLSNDVADERRNSITGATGYDLLANADLIIEAAFETMDVKDAIFKSLDAIARSDAILATNTSYLDIDAIAAVTSRPSQVLGLHYFSPANVMKLLEIVRGRETDPTVLATALAFARRTGKVPVVAGVCHGFIGNRMLRAYNREAGLLLLEGATPSQIDTALTDFGMAMGPFAVADLSGIDIGHKGRQAMEPGAYEPAAFRVHDGLVSCGFLGRKTAVGFYRYASGKVDGENADVADIVAAARKEFAVSPRSIDPEEIVERCIFAAAAEGLQIVKEGIAARPGDVDVVYVNGYGFPRHRGGPIFYLRETGEAGLAAIRRYAAGPFGRWWPDVGHPGAIEPPGIGKSTDKDAA